MIETFATSIISSIVMLMTMSQNGDANYYDVERWAARNRVISTDNNKQTPRPFTPPVADEFIESTLPYELVITSAEKLPGPRGDAPFVIDQSYRVATFSGDTSVNRLSPKPPSQRVMPVFNATTNLGDFRPEPLLDDVDKAAFTKVADKPDNSKGSAEGSGGNYLSNKIFYRTARVRNTLRPTLASGHFHIPPTDNQPTTVGAALISRVTTAVTGFLNSLAQRQPVITSFSPVSGFPGATITINGERFDGTLDVRIGSVSVEHFGVSPDFKQITATTGQNAVTGLIEVETAYGVATSSQDFRVIPFRVPPEEFATLLRRRRLALGREPREVAAELGVTPGTYTRWERGDDRPSPRFRPAIVRFLGDDPNPAPQSVGERIRANRLREGLSQSELAE